jgi:hypothetical protein
MRTPSAANTFARLATIACALACTDASAAAQTNRTLTLVNAPQLGQIAAWDAHYPPAAAGGLGALLMSPYQYLVQPPINLPLPSVGFTRVNLTRLLYTDFYVLDASGSHSWTMQIPNDRELIGMRFDLQTVDATPSNLYWSDNDLELTVAPGSAGPDLELVRVPPGSFLMGGAPNGAALANELPQRLVTIQSPFWMSRTEITQGQYWAVTGVNPASWQRVSDPQTNRLPVENVSWHMAVDFCRQLTAMEEAAGRLPQGMKYRLPTEAEWEYACRGGTTTEFAVGPLTYLTCADARVVACGMTLTGPLVPVASYAPNPFGLHDMHGNVSEWCLDSWDATANYATAGTVDPVVTNGFLRVVRGGGTDDSPVFCRSSYRWGRTPGERTVFCGFRVVLASR